MRFIEKEVSKLLSRVIKDDIQLSVPPDSSMGDAAFPCFALSKREKKNPADIAKELAGKLKPSGIIKEIKPNGPYVNFYADKQKLAARVIKDIISSKDSYGSSANNEKVMVEFVSPNTNKALHLGHVRNGCLGLALSNILGFAGFKVVRTCVNNDRGVGMCEAMLGYQMFHDGETPKSKPDKFVAQCYVDFKKAEKADPKLKENSAECLRKWEAGDSEVIELWKKITSWVYEGYHQTYSALGISFDKQYYESELYSKGRDIVNAGLKKGVFKKEDGAVVAKLEKHGLPDKVLIKSDGTTLYMTQDIYLAKLKYDDFKVDSSVYVVASEQDNHFRQLFKILELLGFPFAGKCHHFSYGLVNLPSGRMKSREGTVVDADDIISDITTLAEIAVRQRHKSLSEEEVSKRAIQIGVGALKFFMLKFDAKTSFTFNPEESLSFEGETGPYVQYAHARICSILRKQKLAKPDFGVLTDPHEERLVTLLGEFPDRVEESALNYRTHIIPRYLIELAQAFNEFYHSVPVLKADAERNARLALVDSVRQVLKNGLGLMSIEAPEQM